MNATTAIIACFVAAQFLLVGCAWLAARRLTKKRCPRCSSPRWPRANFCPSCGLQHSTDKELWHWWMERRDAARMKREATREAEQK